MGSILFIAPFKELADLAQKVIHRMGLSIPVIMANNENAVSAVENYPDKMILISRGGTANDLKELSEKTIVEINASFSDIFVSIEKAVQSGYKSIGIVTNNNIIDNFVRDFSLENVHIWHRPCKTHEEIRNMVAYLHKQGVQYIIGCHQAVAKARELGLANEYIESGELSIQKSISEAIRIEKTKKLSQFQMERMNAVINNIQEGIVIFGQNHEPVFFNTLANKVFDGKSREQWYKKILSQSNIFSKEKVIVIGNNKILLKSIPLAIQDNKNDVFIFQEVSNIEKQERRIRLSTYHKGFYAKTHFSDIVTNSAKMKEVLERAEKFASADSNVLIYGETGSGKEGVAQGIHNASRRASQAFVSINCASLPPNLVESELFGYVDGAFTGARKSGKAGLFEMAHKGTIFLDEIAELPLDIQGRLLRVLQEQEVMRIGDDKIIPLDIRIICATNKNLQKLAREEKFRYDLYYRINVLRVKIPALRERREDILPLLDFYFRHFNNEGRGIELDAAARDRILRYPWPGNIRELKNVAEVLAFEDKTIQVRQLEELLEEIPIAKCGKKAEEEICVSPNLTLKEMEREILEEMTQWYSAEEICRKMGISRVTLWRKLKNVSQKKQ